MITILLSRWIKSLSVTIQMKATEQYFPVVLFIILYKVVQTFESVDEILQCDHSNESYWAVLSCGAVYYAVQGGSNFWVCRWNPKVWPFKWKLLSSTLLVMFIILYKVARSLDEILQCDHSNEMKNWEKCCVLVCASLVKWTLWAVQLFVGVENCNRFINLLWT